MSESKMIEECEKLFKTHSGKLPTTSSDKDPKMKYHILADGVFWCDEGLNNKDEYNLENHFRAVINYRTFLITRQLEPSATIKYIYDLAKKYFPNWIGFTDSRCSYDENLANRIARIRKVSDWRVDKLLNEST